jgi:hypothetical protein
MATPLVAANRFVLYVWLPGTDFLGLPVHGRRQASFF